MSKTSETFPSNWENLNANKIGSYFTSSISSGTTDYMTNTENELWNEQMKDNRERVMARLRNNRNRNELLRNGGWYSTAPKNQPQGSFNTPLNLNGNTTYGLNKNNQRLLLGGARTNEGIEYSRNLLKQRAQQLEEIKLASETGQSLEPTIQPSTELESVRTTLDLLISNLNNQFMSGEFGEMRKEDINKIYGTLKENGIVLPNSDIKRYYEIFQNMRETIEQLLVSNDAELRKRLILLMPQNVGLAVFKIAVLLRVLISVKNFAPNEQKQLINSISSQLLKAKNREEIFNIDDGLYQRFQALEPPAQRLLTDAEVVAQAVDITRQAQQRFKSKKALEKTKLPPAIKQLERQVKELEFDIERINRQIDIAEEKVVNAETPPARGRAQVKLDQEINKRAIKIAELEPLKRQLEDEIEAFETAPINTQQFVYGRGTTKG